MHPDLAAFASTYRHAFPDLVITTAADGEDLRLEWQESPTSPCYSIAARMSGEGFIVFEYVGGVVRAVSDPVIASAVAALSRERGLSVRGNEPLLAEPGTFAALVLERHLLTPPARSQSPDRLTGPSARAGASPPDPLGAAGLER